MDLSSWQGVFTTLMSLAIVTLIGVGIRVLMMQTIQQRRERMNRQINEHLRTLIAAYKTLKIHPSNLTRSLKIRTGEAGRPAAGPPRD